MTARLPGSCGLLPEQRCTGIGGARGGLAAARRAAPALCGSKARRLAWRDQRVAQRAGCRQLSRALTAPLPARPALPAKQTRSTRLSGEEGLRMFGIGSRDRGGPPGGGRPAEGRWPAGGRLGLRRQRLELLLHLVGAGRAQPRTEAPPCPALACLVRFLSAATTSATQRTMRPPTTVPAAPSLRCVGPLFSRAGAGGPAARAVQRGRMPSTQHAHCCCTVLVQRRNSRTSERSSSRRTGLLRVCFLPVRPPAG